LSLSVWRINWICCLKNDVLNGQTCTNKEFETISQFISYSDWLSRILALDCELNILGPVIPSIRHVKTICTPNHCMSASLEDYSHCGKFERGCHFISLFDSVLKLIEGIS
jgi:hypothetical protein